MNSNQFLNIKQVCAMLGISRATLYRMRKAGVFPEPIQLFERRVGWHVSVVQEWIDDRVIID